MGHVRLSRWLIAGATTAALVAAPLATAGTALAAAPPTPTDTAGLYGTKDATYDGVFRQSLAILGLHAAGKTPNQQALGWLHRQQCADGGFSSYNPDTSKPCPAYNPTAFSGGEDTNATAMAVQALLAVGDTARANRAAGWLRDLQNADGGWEYTAKSGSGSDPNSSGLVMTALTAAKLVPKSSAISYFAGIQVGRTDFAGTDATKRGGFATPWQPGNPDVLATVQAVPALSGASLLSRPAGTPWNDDVDPAPSAVPADTATGITHWATTWLASQVDADKVTGSNATWAILSFAWDRRGEDRAYALYDGKVKGNVQTDNPGANGLATVAAAVLGRSADVATYADRIAATLQRDVAAPLVSLTAPGAAKKATSWKRIKVSATDTIATAIGSGVATVKVAVTEKRGSSWYSYTGKKWAKVKNGKARSWLRASHTGGHWVVKVNGLTRGKLKVRASATDAAGNASRVATLTQLLTR